MEKIPSALAIERIDSVDVTEERFRRKEHTLTPWLLTDAFSVCAPALREFASDYVQYLSEYQHYDAETAAAECAAIQTAGSVQHPRYYGGDASLNFEESAMYYSASHHYYQPPHQHLGDDTQDNESQVQRHLNSRQRRGLAPTTGSGIAQRNQSGGEDMSAALVDKPRLQQQQQPQYASIAAVLAGSSVGGIDIIDDDAYRERLLLSLKVEALQVQQRRTNMPSSAIAAAASATTILLPAMSSEGAGVPSRRLRNDMSNGSVEDSALSIAGLDDASMLSTSSAVYGRRPLLMLQDIALILQSRRSEKLRKSGSSLSNCTTERDASAYLAASPQPQQIYRHFPVAPSANTPNIASLSAVATGGSTTPRHHALHQQQQQQCHVALCEKLRGEPGILNFKASIAQCDALLSELQLDRLFTPQQYYSRNQEPRWQQQQQQRRGRNSGENSKYKTGKSKPSSQIPAVAQSPLLLKPDSYFAWLTVGEPGSGTRTHVSVMGAHAWHVVLRGCKRWRIAHPLDKHLLIRADTGEVADLNCIDYTKFPDAYHARIYECTQGAGEALFLPSEGLYTELICDSSCTEGDKDKAEDSGNAEGSSGSSTGVGANDLSTCVALHVNVVDNTCLLMNEKYTRENAVLQAKSNGDILLPEVVPLTTVDVVLFDDNVYPSFRGNNRPYRPHSRLSLLLLRTVVEFSQIKMPCSELGARIEMDAFQDRFAPLGECLLDTSQDRKEEGPPRTPHYVIGVPKGYRVSHLDHHLTLYYFVEPPTMAAVRACLARPTCRRKVCASMQFFECDDTTLPPAHWFRSTCSHQGRVPNYAPLSVLLRQRWPFEAKLCEKLVSLPRIILDKSYSPQGFVRTGSVWHYSRFDASDAEAPVTSRGGVVGAHLFDKASNVTTLLAAVLKSSFTSMLDLRELEDQPGDGWCRTFLFYCSPSLDRPLFMHPVQGDVHLLNAKCLLETWEDTGSSENDSTSSSSNTSSDGKAVTKEQDATEEEDDALPFCPRIVEFEWNVNTLEEYGMVNLIQLGTDMESMRAMVEQTVVQDASFPAFQQFVRDHCMQPIELVGECSVENVMASVLWFFNTPRVVGFACGRRASSEVACVQVDEDDDPAGEWDTVCLTATAASALLVCVQDSIYASIATRLCNWLCDIPLEMGTEREACLLAEVQQILLSADVEEQTIVYDVQRVKHEILEGCSGDGCTTLTGKSVSLCTKDRSRTRPVNQERLFKLEELCGYSL